MMMMMIKMMTMMMMMIKMMTIKMMMKMMMIRMGITSIPLLID